MDNESKHTPGPWMVNQDYIEAPMGRCRARIAIIDDGAGIYNPEANARLIAAAPEMLEALKWIETQEIWRDDLNEVLTVQRQIREKARAATSLALDGPPHPTDVVERQTGYE